MITNSYYKTTTSPHKTLQRIIFGAGALGLFLANEFASEYPDDLLVIISNKVINKKIIVQNRNNEQKIYNPKIVSVADVDAYYENIHFDNMIFYTCVHPQELENTIKNIVYIISKNGNNKNYIVVFLNNGFINLNNINNYFTNSLCNNSSENITIIRAIVSAGFVKLSSETLITSINTIGKNIYYNFCKKISKIIPTFSSTKELSWILSEDIFKLEKAKFLVNFMLGYFIGPNIRENSDILSIFSEEKLLKICINYALLFNDENLDFNYVYHFFLDTIKQTSKNINSISLSWHNGSTEVIHYFISEMKTILSNSESTTAKKIFYDLLAFESK